jgi:hypothetical protein
MLDAKRTLEYPDGGREVVDAPGGSEGGDDDAGGGHEIVGEGVVEVALQLEDVLHALKLLLVSVRAGKRNIGQQSLSHQINQYVSKHADRPFEVPQQSRFSLPGGDL